MPINTAAEAEGLLEEWEKEAKDAVDAAGGNRGSNSDYSIEISEALFANRRNDIQRVKNRLEEIRDNFDIKDENADLDDVGARQDHRAIAHDEDGKEVHETTEADEIDRVIDLYDKALKFQV